MPFPCSSTAPQPLQQSLFPCQPHPPSACLQLHRTINTKKADYGFHSHHTCIDPVCLFEVMEDDNVLRIGQRVLRLSLCVGDGGVLLKLWYKILTAVVTGALIESLTGGNTFAFLCEALFLYVSALSILLVHTHTYTDLKNMIISDCLLCQGLWLVLSGSITRLRGEGMVRKKNKTFGFPSALLQLLRLTGQWPHNSILSTLKLKALKEYVLILTCVLRDFWLMKWYTSNLKARIACFRSLFLLWRSIESVDGCRPLCHAILGYIESR